MKVKLIKGSTYTVSFLIPSAPEMCPENYLSLLPGNFGTSSYDIPGRWSKGKTLSVVLPYPSPSGDRATSPPQHLRCEIHVKVLQHHVLGTFYADMQYVRICRKALSKMSTD